MCRNIKPLFNFDPPATEEEIRNAALQYVRKISGMQKPSEVNSIAFEKAIEEILQTTQNLLTSLKTSAKHKKRETEAHKVKLRNMKRFHKDVEQA